MQPIARTFLRSFLNFCLNSFLAGLISLSIYNVGFSAEYDLPSSYPPGKTSSQKQSNRDWQSASLNKAQRWLWTPSLYLSQGRSDFNWSIGSNSESSITPNILSELTYRDLYSTHWNLDNQFLYPLNNQWNWSNQIKFSTGVINAGQVQDSDYDQDNRNAEYSRSYSQPKGSILQDLTFATGLQRQLTPQWQATGLIGVSQHQQSFSKNNGEQVLATQNRTPGVGKFGGLNSEYAAQWRSLWLGFGTQWQWQRHQFAWQIEQHISDYYAAANWNLRSDFAHPKSFDQNATGQAQVVSLSYQRALTSHLNMLLLWQHEHWQTAEGIDTVYFANGTQASTRLNEAQWNSQRLSIGLNLTTW